MGLFGVNLEQEDVPPDKKFMISTRENSEYKWRQDFPDQIFGALEIPSDPVLNVKSPDYTSRPVRGKEDLLDEALELWDEWKLRDEFVKAVDGVPVETCCCGLITDSDATVKSLVPALNRGWVHDVNRRLRNDRAGFKLDAYLWHWTNAMGKAETNILLIRFLEEPVADGDSEDDASSSLHTDELRLSSEERIDVEGGGGDEDHPAGATRNVVDKLPSSNSSSQP